MTKHPLTLAQIKKLARRYTCDMESGEYSFGEDTVRAAADWQLEKCDDELGNILHCLAIAGKITGEERIQIYVLFKEAMRPTIKMDPDDYWIFSDSKNFRKLKNT